MNKEWIINNWELDWDNEDIYFKVTKDGDMIKYDISTNTIYKYKIDQVAQ